MLKFCGKPHELKEFFHSMMEKYGKKTTIIELMVMLEKEAEEEEYFERMKKLEKGIDEHRSNNFIAYRTMDDKYVCQFCGEPFNSVSCEEVCPDCLDEYLTFDNMIEAGECCREKPYEMNLFLETFFSVKEIEEILIKHIKENLDERDCKEKFEEFLRVIDRDWFVRKFAMKLEGH